MHTILLAHYSLSGSEEAFPEAGAVFSYDIIYKKEVYNGDMFCLYLQDLYTGFNIIYIYRSTGDSLLIIDTIFT